MIVFVLLDVCACAAACVPFVDCVIIIRLHKLSSTVQIPQIAATKRQITKLKKSKNKDKTKYKPKADY